MVLGALLLAAGCRHASPPFYPLGIYSVRSTNDFAAISAAGFTVVSGPAEPGYLGAARTAGLRVLASFGTRAGGKFDEAKAREAVARFDRHPALWAWYLADEPDLNGVSPPQVERAHRALKRAGAGKPTALVLSKGYEALHYAPIADITMIDYYPISWLPLAAFPKQVRQARLALGRSRPMVAVIQAFDWSRYPAFHFPEKDLRAPTPEELRCMAYAALVCRATGRFFYPFNDGCWDMRREPRMWEALCGLVTEIRERQPLFQSRQLWWPYTVRFGDPLRRFNAALEAAIQPAFLRVRRGSQCVPAGDYLLAVNTTDQAHSYRISLPYPRESLVPVLGEDRACPVASHWLTDEFAPWAVHVYGPLTGRDKPLGPAPIELDE